MNNHKKINTMVTGANGFIGYNIVKNFGDTLNIFPVTRGNLNLFKPEEIRKFVFENKIDVIIHCAVTGGRRLIDELPGNVFVNLRMYECINLCSDLVKTVIYFGSGAEFDREKDINETSGVEGAELDVIPSDPYGFAKNIINRRILTSANWYNLRLFGCFHHTEESQRFIKSNILRHIKGEPIIVHQDKFMDFFYLDDLLKIVEYYVFRSHVESLPHSMNICYDKKYRLSDLANIICSLDSNKKSNVVINEPNHGLNYCGNGKLLKRSMNLDYIGLEKGIERTYLKLKSL